MGDPAYNLYHSGGMVRLWSGVAAQDAPPSNIYWEKAGGEGRGGVEDLAYNLCDWRHGRPPRWRSGKASASRAEDPGFESRLRRDFFGVESYQ